MGTEQNDRLSQLRNLLENDPHDAFCMYGIAMEHAKANRHTEAIAWFDQTIETDPAYTYAWYHKARCLDDAGKTEEAIQTLEEGMKQAKLVGDSHAAEEMASLYTAIQ
tara:strand:- start:616 stop:939 length:324 start_codon:yes stop_codon:yes gene_type:complete